MYHVSCNGCHLSAYVGCTCEDIGHSPQAVWPPAHHPLCQMADLGSNVVCDCCTQEHSHDANANACPGILAGHEGAPCSHPNPFACEHYPEVSADPEKQCPGGHCGGGVKGCQVCRPVTITAMPGSTRITMNGGLADGRR